MSSRVATVVLETDRAGNVTEAAVLRTARKRLEGEVFA